MPNPIAPIKAITRAIALFKRFVLKEDKASLCDGQAPGNFAIAVNLFRQKGCRSLNPKSNLLNCDRLEKQETHWTSTLSGER